MQDVIGQTPKPVASKAAAQLLPACAKAANDAAPAIREAAVDCLVGFALKTGVSTPAKVRPDRQLVWLRHEAETACGLLTTQLPCAIECRVSVRTDPSSAVTIAEQQDYVHRSWTSWTGPGRSGWRTCCSRPRGAVGALGHLAQRAPQDLPPAKPLPGCAVPCVMPDTCTWSAFMSTAEGTQ